MFIRFTIFSLFFFTSGICFSQQREAVEVIEGLIKEKKFAEAEHKLQQRIDSFFSSGAVDSVVSLISLAAYVSRCHTGDFARVTRGNGLENHLSIRRVAMGVMHRHLKTEKM